MLPFQRQQFHEVMNWVDRHPEARTMPGLISSAVDRILRYDQVQAVQAGEITISLDPYELETIRDDLLADSGSWSERREAEHQIADYMREVASATGLLDLVQQAERHDECRLHGAVGLKPGGGTMIAWDSKCGSVRTCPDESREETQRLTEFYLPAMLDWVKTSPTHRIFYGVFTTHNYRAGGLAGGKRDLLEKFKAWMNHQADACPVRFWEQHGITHVVRSRKKKMPPTFNIKGALVIQEDPLSAAGDWNVHLNVFLLVKGAFDFKQARQLWGANLHLQQIEGDAAKLRASLLEAIKYSAQFVPGKSSQKAAEGSTAAPAMVEWPHWRFAEWWTAQKGFRRVRSYGCLYALHGKRWDAMDVRDRVDLCRIAEIVDSGAAGKVWKEIEEEPRNALREAMVHGERLDMSLVEWIGSVSFQDGAGYSVDLIPGDNFLGSRQKRTTFHSGAGVSSSGAPPPW